MAADRPSPIHVLDTSAIYLFHDKRRTGLHTLLHDAFRNGEGIIIPEPAFVEANQARALYFDRVDELLKIAEFSPLSGRDISEHVAHGLRKVQRVECETCGTHTGPSIVDAYVMATAHWYASVEGVEAYVYTSDKLHFDALGAALYHGVIVHQV